jgi:hypothetical protein
VTLPPTLKASAGFLPEIESRGYTHCCARYLIFWGNCFSGFENVIILSVILRHLEAELSILRCLKTHHGIISTFF